MLSTEQVLYIDNLQRIFHKLFIQSRTNISASLILNHSFSQTKRVSQLRFTAPNRVENSPYLKQANHHQEIALELRNILNLY